MTVLAMVADGPYLVLASDDSCRGNLPLAFKRKLHPLTPTIAAAFGGVAWGSTWPAELAITAVMDRFAATLPAWPTVESVAQDLAPHLLATYRDRWPGQDTAQRNLGLEGFVAGYNPGSSHPEVWALGLTSAGVVKLCAIVRGGNGGTLVIPPNVTGPERTRRPESLADADAIARELVQGRIEEHARHPERGRDAMGPVHCLSLVPDRPAVPV